LILFLETYTIHKIPSNIVVKPLTYYYKYNIDFFKIKKKGLKP